MNRSIDYRAEMERIKDSEFSGWDNFWIPVKGWIAIGGMIFFIGWLCWLLIRPFL